MEGTLHIYHPTRHLPLFLYTHPSTTPPRSILLFIGGMYDNFLNTSYVNDLASLLRHAPTYRLIHAQLSSSGRQFGVSSLDKDVSEMVSAVTFIRATPSLGGPDVEIILMGHSTGCQDVLHYLTSPGASTRPLVHGAILQAPVSDREGLLDTVSHSAAAQSHYTACLDLISRTAPSEHPTTLLPLHHTTPLLGPAPMSMSRFLSLASPTSPSNPSADDKFSSDLAPSALADTYGALTAPNSPLPPPHRTILVLISGSDEYMASSIAKPSLLANWDNAIKASGRASLHASSAVIADARHDLSGESHAARVARLVEMRTRVIRYLSDVSGDVGEECRQALERDSRAIEVERRKEEGIETAAEGVSGMKL